MHRRNFMKLMAAGAAGTVCGYFPEMVLAGEKKNGNCSPPILSGRL